MLKIEHLTKTYGEKKAVDDLSLHIQAGELYGFIGHNGAGKTTTLKATAGILPFTEGQILIGGRDIREQPLPTRDISAYTPVSVQAELMRIDMESASLFLTHGKNTSFS